MIQRWKILLTEPNGMIMERPGMLKLEELDKFSPLFAFTTHWLDCSFLISPGSEVWFVFFNLFCLNLPNQVLFSQQLFGFIAKIIS